jgi:hypothetical protein
MEFNDLIKSKVKRRLKIFIEKGKTGTVLKVLLGNPLSEKEN